MEFNQNINNLKTIIGNENIVLIPLFKQTNDKNKAGSYAFSYKSVLENYDDVDSIKNEIKKMASKYPSYNLEWDLYIDPRFTNVQVIDVDHYDQTMKIFSEIARLNPEFEKFYMRLNEEILSKTLTVETKSGGRHYYIKRKLESDTKRATKTISIYDYLDKDTIKNNEILSLVAYGKISVDYLFRGVVRSPWHKSFLCGEPRVYKTVNEAHILEINSDMEDVLNYFFRFKDKSKKKS